MFLSVCLWGGLCVSTACPRGRGHAWDSTDSVSTSLRTPVRTCAYPRDRVALVCVRIYFSTRGLMGEQGPRPGSGSQGPPSLSPSRAGQRTRGGQSQVRVRVTGHAPGSRAGISQRVPMAVPVGGDRGGPSSQLPAATGLHRPLCRGPGWAGLEGERRGKPRTCRPPLPTSPGGRPPSVDSA